LYLIYNLVAGFSNSQVKFRAKVCSLVMCAWKWLRGRNGGNGSAGEASPMDEDYEETGAIKRGNMPEIGVRGLG
jgi:hypothetical protein